MGQVAVTVHAPAFPGNQSQIRLPTRLASWAANLLLWSVILIDGPSKWAGCVMEKPGIC